MPEWSFPIKISYTEPLFHSLLHDLSAWTLAQQGLPSCIGLSVQVASERKPRFWFLLWTTLVVFTSDRTVCFQTVWWSRSKKEQNGIWSPANWIQLQLGIFSFQKRMSSALLFAAKVHGEFPVYSRYPVLIGLCSICHCARVLRWKKQTRETLVKVISCQNSKLYELFKTTCFYCSVRWTQGSNSFPQTKQKNPLILAELRKHTYHISKRWARRWGQQELRRSFMVFTFELFGKKFNTFCDQQIMNFWQ